MGKDLKLHNSTLREVLNYISVYSGNTELKAELEQILASIHNNHMDKEFLEGNLAGNYLTDISQTIKNHTTE